VSRGIVQDDKLTEGWIQRAYTGGELKRSRGFVEIKSAGNHRAIWGGALETNQHDGQKQSGRTAGK